MRRSVEIQPCSNRFVSIGSSFFHWGASFLSLTAYGGLRAPCGIRSTPLPFGDSALTGGVPDFTLELFRISIEPISIAILDFCQVRVRRSLGRVSISFHTAPDSPLGKILVTPLVCLRGVTKIMSRGGNQKTKRGQGGLEPPTSRTRSENHTSRPLAHAALAQLGERQTEDLKVPGSIPGGGTCFFLQKRGQGGIEPPTSPTLRENHATRPLAHQMRIG